MTVVYKDNTYGMFIKKTSRPVIKQAVIAIMMLKERFREKTFCVHELIRRSRSVTFELGCHMDK